jgi:AcrR family transcriptional regulator
MARSIARDHDEKRMGLLASAAKVFATEGFERASMARIAAEAGISKANIYHYYDSKHALLYDILDTYLTELRDRVIGLDLSGLDPEAQLRAVVTETLLAYQGMDHKHQIQSSGIPMLAPEQQESLRGIQRELVEQMSGILLALAPEALADRAALRAATMSVYGMLNWFYMWNGRAGAEARRAYARVVCDMVLGGVRGIRP